MRVTASTPQLGPADTPAAAHKTSTDTATHSADPQPLPHNENPAHNPSQHPHSCRKTHKNLRCIPTKQRQKFVAMFVKRL